MYKNIVIKKSSIVFWGLCITLSASIFSTTFIKIFFPGFPFTYIEFAGLLAAFFLFFNFSLRFLFFLIPFILILTLSVLFNVVDITKGGINTYITTLTSLLIVSSSKTMLNKQDVERLGRLLIVLILILNIFGLAGEFYTGFLLNNGLKKYKSSFGFFFNRNAAAVSLFVAFVISLYVIRNRIIQVFVSITFFSIIILTGSRGALLGIIIIILYKIIEELKKIIFRFTTKKIVFLIGLCVMLTILIGFKEISNQLIKMYNRTIVSGTTHRSEMWKDLIVANMENGRYVLIGSGPMSTSYDLVGHRVIRYPTDNNTGLYSHNAFVEVFSWYGCLGLLFSFFVLYLIYRRISSPGVFWAMVAINFVESDLFKLSLLWLLFIYLIVLKDVDKSKV